jgi:hypothetical protein
MDELKARLGLGRRIYAFMHPALVDEPLVFVNIALMAEPSTNIQHLLQSRSATAAGLDIHPSIHPSVHFRDRCNKVTSRACERALDAHMHVRAHARLHARARARAYRCQYVSGVHRRTTKSAR